MTLIGWENRPIAPTAGVGCVVGGVFFDSRSSVLGGMLCVTVMMLPNVATLSCVIACAALIGSNTEDIEQKPECHGDSKELY